MVSRVEGTLYNCIEQVVVRYLANDNEALQAIFCMINDISPSECQYTRSMYRVRALYDRFAPCYKFKDKLLMVYDRLAYGDIEQLVDPNFEKCKCGANLWRDIIITLNHLRKVHYTEIKRIVNMIIRDVVGKGGGND